MFKNQKESEDHFELMQEINNMTVGETPCMAYPEAFFDSDETEGMRGITTETNIARRLCQDCEVKFACREYAVKWNVDGIWGGLTFGERRTIRRQRGITQYKNKRFS